MKSSSAFLSLLLLVSSFSYSETIYIRNFLDFGSDFITPNDPTHISSFSYVGLFWPDPFCVTWDGGHNIDPSGGFHTFSATLHDQYAIEINVSDSFRLGEAEWYARLVSETMGRLPAFIYTQEGIRRIDISSSGSTNIVPLFHDQLLQKSICMSHHTIVGPLFGSRSIEDDFEEHLLAYVAKAHLEHLFRDVNYPPEESSNLQAAYEIAKAADRAPVTSLAHSSAYWEVAESLSAWILLNYFPDRFAIPDHIKHITSTIHYRLNVFDHHFFNTDLLEPIIKYISINEGGHFDFETSILHTKNIDVGGEYYNVDLQLENNGTFTLKGYELIERE